MNGISPIGLLLGALFPTLIMAFMFMALTPVYMFFLDLARRLVAGL